MAHFEHELLEHRKDPPEKGARSRLIQEYCKKESYFKSEVISNLSPCDWLMEQTDIIQNRPSVQLKCVFWVNLII